MIFSDLLRDKTLFDTLYLTIMDTIYIYIYIYIYMLERYVFRNNLLVYGYQY